MEDLHIKKNKLQMLYSDAKNSLFTVMQELLKHKTIGQWFASFLMIVMMFQMITFLFESKV